MTAFIERSGKILLLRRSNSVGTYRGKWAGVSGYLEGDPPLHRALTEVREELGILPEEVRLETAGEPLSVNDPELGMRWLVHPFRFTLLVHRDPRLDWEHVEMRWISEEMLSSMDVVVGLREAWERVRD